MGKNTSKQLRAAMLEDLARSGIPESTLPHLQFAPRDVIETRKELGLRHRCEAQTYQIPYFHPDGSRTNYSRFRLLEGKWDTDHPESSKYKYNQRLGTLPHLYFPPVIEWPIENGKICLPYLCITEGEKKAIKACLTDIPTVALGGVYSFAAKKKQITLLDEFELFDLTETQIEICFDSDVHTNNDVRLAMNKLASELTPFTKKHIRYVMLDGESTDKWGLDDFLNSFKTPRKAEQAFWALPRREDKRSAAVVDFDEILVFVSANGRYFNLPDRRWYLRKEDISNEFENMPKVPHPDKPDTRVAPVKIWFDQRKPETTIQDVSYEPGKPPRYPGSKSDIVNVWRPSKIKPVEGEPTAWLELFDFLTDSLPQSQKKWLMQWFAYPLQHLGAKVHQAIFIYSHAEGIGKNLLVDPFMRHIYGEENFSIIGGDALEEIYNAWITRKQFVFVDEVHVGNKNERVKSMNRLKRYVTDPHVNVREMYTPRHELKNCAQIYMSSQHSDGLVMSEKDRRFFVIEGPSKPQPASFYQAVEELYLSPEGYGQVLNHLLQVDLEGYNPRSHPPETKAKVQAVTHAMDGGGYYASLIRNSPSELFAMNGKLPDRELFTAAEICTSINTHSAKMGSKFWTTPNSMGKYLVNAGLVHRRVTMRVKKQVCTTTLYAIFNPDSWRATDRLQWVKHFQGKQ